MLYLWIILILQLFSIILLPILLDVGHFSYSCVACPFVFPGDAGMKALTWETYHFVQRNHV